MASWIVAAVVVVCLVAASSGSVPLRRLAPRDARVHVPDGSANQRSVVSGPINVAVTAGSPIGLDCVASVTGSPRIQWYEYATSEIPQLISDGESLLPSHPNSARYALNFNAATHNYHLVISPTILADGGRYQCKDASVENDEGFSAQLVIIEATPNCTTTIPSDGIVTEESYQTIECQVQLKASTGISPVMTWSGPGVYQQTSASTDTTVWSLIQFNANKSMNARTFQCLTNFTEQGFGGTLDMAANVPTWSYTYTSPELIVHYGPQNVSYSPVLSSYEIGMVLTCNAEAAPQPSFIWTNLETLTDYHSQSLTLTESMVGSLPLRCHVVNDVSSTNVFVNITVNPRTTPPSTTATTTVVPVSPCSDLTGRWEAKRADASTIVLCLSVDVTQNGLLHGLLQNDTSEPYLTELIGRTRIPQFDELGFTGIWPQKIGVTGYAGECRRCYGTETLLVSLVSRSSTDSQFCLGGNVLNNPQVTFTRKPLSYPCSAKISDMEANLVAANSKWRV